MKQRPWKTNTHARVGKHRHRHTHTHTHTHERAHKHERVPAHHERSVSVQAALHHCQGRWCSLTHSLTQEAGGTQESHKSTSLTHSLTHSPTHSPVVRRHPGVRPTHLDTRGLTRERRRQVGARREGGHGPPGGLEFVEVRLRVCCMCVRVCVCVRDDQVTWCWWDDDGCRW